MGLTYKIADQAWEFEQIHKLNYKTFVEEIPQHEETDEKIRIDRFHEENTYLICLDNDKVVGMVAVRGQRPFSLDYKIHNLDERLPERAHVLYEVRLLAVEKEYRSGRTLLGLGRFLHRYLLLQGYDIAVISGTTREIQLYKQIGFQPFSTLVGTEEAAFQPMYITPQLFAQSKIAKIVNKEYTYLPGPVEIMPNVQKAFASVPISHRSNQCKVTMKQVQKQLLRMTKATTVQVLFGTGTLANDAIALQLQSLRSHGLILRNGEFGNRLTEHGKRANLSFDTYETTMGEPFSYEKIKQLLIGHQYEWLWFVQHETSTGMLNDLLKIIKLCKQYNVKVCVDCISSIGAIPLDLKDVYLASGVSGKAIGAYTGLSFVFYNHHIEPNEDIPKYMDIGEYETNESIPYSHSWNLIFALHEALKKFEDDAVYGRVYDTYEFLQKEIVSMGLRIITQKEYAAPVIMTIELPKEISSTKVGDMLALQGFVIHYESSYLKENNWIQISCLNPYKERDIKSMLACLQMHTKSLVW